MRKRTKIIGNIGWYMTWIGVAIMVPVMIVSLVAGLLRIENIIAHRLAADLWAWFTLFMLAAMGFQGYALWTHFNEYKRQEMDDKSREEETTKTG